MRRLTILFGYTGNNEVGDEINERSENVGILQAWQRYQICMPCRF